MLTCDDYLSPTTLDEAFDAMERHHGAFRLVAGATDILPWAREGRAGDVHIPVLIDVARIPELNVREILPGSVQFGAATRFQRFLDDKELMAALPVMPYCAVWFADDQIRESATIGGNLVNASPAADGTPALLVLDASVVVAHPSAGHILRHTIPLQEFLSGPGTTMLSPDEIVTHIECNGCPGYGGAFEKVGHRRSLVISTVCVAALVKLDPARAQFADVRLAVAGIGPVPQRLTAIERMLNGRPVTAAGIEDAAAKAVDAVASRTRQQYRREVVVGFVLRALVNAARRAGASGKLITPELEARYA